MKDRKNIRIALRELVLLVIACPLMLAFFYWKLPKLPSSPFMRDSFWAHKIDAKPVYDIVLTGDSRIYRGVDPAVIESALGHQGKCLNYGFSAAGLDSFLLAKASALLDPAGNRILVVGISANSFMPDALKNRHLHSLLGWDPKNVWIKKHIYPSITCFDAYAVSDLVKLARGERYIEHYHLDNGYAASTRIPLDSASALPSYREQFSLYRYDKTAEDRFLNQLARLKSKDIRVIVFRVPVAQAMRELEDSVTSHSLDLLKQKVLAAGGYWMETGNTSYVSYDGSHLDQASAEKLAGCLAREIRICAD